MKNNVSKKFKKQLKDLKEYVALAIIDVKDYQKTNLKIIKHFTEDENIPGVYVTLSKPYKTVEKTLKSKGIDTRLIIFIDTVTKTTDGEFKKTDNCLFIGSPEKLSDISVAMDQAVRSLPSEKRFVFFDSLSILLMYNNAATVARFIHFLSGKMRTWAVQGIIVSLKKEKDNGLIDELMQFCDVKLEL